MSKEYCNAIDDECAFPSLECKKCLHGKSETKEETDMDKLTTEFAEYICGAICKHPSECRTQEELIDMCYECEVGKFICDILNTYNKINDLQNSECAKMLEKMQTIDKLYLEKCVEVNKLKSELEKTMQLDIEICSFELVDYKDLYLKKCQEVNRLKEELDCKADELKHTYMKEHLIHQEASRLKAELDKYRWIPVSERLPEEAFGCLVTIMDCNPMTGSNFENILPYHVGYDGETWNDIDGEVIPFEVIAWMPLPEPYNEDKA